MSVRGLGWYAGAFVALIVSAALIGVAAASFFASLTPLYVSVVCSVGAVALGVVAAVRARPTGASGPDDVAEPGEAVQPSEAIDEPEEPSDETHSAGAAQPADAARPSDSA